MGTEETEPTHRPQSEQLRVADHKAPVLPLVGIGFIASVLGIGLGLLIDWFPVKASTQANQVDRFYDVLIIVSVPMFVIVTAVVLYCVYRFKMRPGEEQMDGPPIHGNTRLEVIWTLIPAVMMLGLCVYAYIELDNAEAAPAKADSELNVRVVGEQFTWTFYYPPAEKGGKEIASSQLYLPVGRSVKFKVQTKDVLHDFWVPAFRWKIDAVPGIDTGYRVTPNRIGTYPVVCAELCGIGHAVMRQTTRVVSQADYDQWLEEKAKGGGMGTDNGGGNVDGGPPDGKGLFASAGCGGCHALANAGTTASTGPNLDDVLADKDAAFIEKSIVDPNAEITEGFGEGIMPPNYGQTLSQDEIAALVKYLQESTKG